MSQSSEPPREARVPHSDLPLGPFGTPLAESPEPDAIERWGRRIGRALGWTALLAMLAYLAWSYGS